MSEVKKPAPPAPSATSTMPESAVIADPKLVKLIRPKEANGQLADAIPVAPVAAMAGALPRLIHDNERAPAGLRRWAIRCMRPVKPKRYVLARTREEAEAHYRQYAKLPTETLIVVPLND